MTMQMKPSPRKIPAISNAMLIALTILPVTVLALGANATMMASVAGIPMNNSDVCSSSLNFSTRNRMLANVTAMMMKITLHCERLTPGVESGMTALQWFGWGRHWLGEVKRQHDHDGEKREVLGGGEDGDEAIAGQQARSQQQSGAANKKLTAV